MTIIFLHTMMYFIKGRNRYSQTSNWYLLISTDALKNILRAIYTFNLATLYFIRTNEKTFCYYNWSTSHHVCREFLEHLHAICSSTLMNSTVFQFVLRETKISPHRNKIKHKNQYVDLPVNVTGINWLCRDNLQEYIVDKKCSQ